MKTKLPTEAHDHFRKANALHKYVQQSLGEATKHALETGKELLAAKARVSHGEWETQCERLFAGSLRTARFYMTFAKDIAKLKSATGVADLLLENTLISAAKTARSLANPSKEYVRSEPDSQDDSDEESLAPEGCTAQDEGSAAVDTDNRTEPDAAVIDYGKCPNCGGRKWADGPEGVACERCHHPHGEAVGDVDEDRVKLQRSKTVKTAEALLRAFDDLQAMLPKPEHKQAVAGCKSLMKMAKDWT